MDAAEAAERKSALNYELPTIDGQKQLTLDIKDRRLSKANEELERSPLLRRGGILVKRRPSCTPNYMKQKKSMASGKEDPNKFQLLQR